MNSLNLFQWLALSVLMATLIFELSLAIHGRVRRRFWALRVLVWIAAGLAIYQPALLTRLAVGVGIQRGTDLVLYVSVLLFVAVSLLLYARCLGLQRQITLIVRDLAIRDAREPGND